MNYALLILVGLVSFAIGVIVVGKRSGYLSNQQEEKARRKEKILELVQSNGKISNNQVEKLLGVSNATAERYLQELENEGKLRQHGTSGPSVFYTTT